MIVEAFLIADAATDSQGKLNLLGAFDTIEIIDLPAIHPSCAIVVRLRIDNKDVGEHNLNINIVDKDNKEIFKTPEGKLNIQPIAKDSFSRMNIIVNIQALKIDNLGLHSINLFIDNSKLFTFPFIVNKIKTK